MPLGPGGAPAPHAAPFPPLERPRPMAQDWSDPDAVEAELARREREAANGAGAPAAPERVLRAVHAVLESQRAARADIARIADELATARARLDRPVDETPAVEGEAAGGPAPATALAEAEGRLTAQVANLKSHIQAVSDALPELRTLANSAAATPGALETLRTTVAPLVEAVRGHTRESRAQKRASSTLEGELKKKMDDAQTALTSRFAEEATRVRTALEENTALVRRRHRRSRRFWLGLAGAVLLALLGSLAGGVWLQWKHAPLPVPDPSGGWRDYLWYEYGPAVRDCIEKARESGRAVHCPIAPPK